ncbi:MAG: ribonuclease E/G [Bacteroidetes bacterium 47-18]|nr:MAG: ribonuclease E/G [Bacteroidetes bacterium 47-18]
MSKEMIINSLSSGVEIALLENKKLVELHYEQSNAEFEVGDLYLGKVKKLMPDLNAAFVDVGFEKDAFLHYTDLSPYIRSLIKFTKTAVNTSAEERFDFSKFRIEPEILKTGKISDVLQNKPEILVQILKEPISSKGPRLSCELSLPGRFVVLTPFNNFVTVSRKIHSGEERKRLLKIVESVKPKNFGIIIRTAAEGKNTAELHADVLELAGTWKTIQKNLKQAKAPQRILSEQTKTTSILRDLLNESFQSIIVNDKKLEGITREYITKIAPEKENIVEYYSHHQSMFDHYGITKQVKASFGKTVNMSSGAYLIIEHTEAMHVIDVNSGTRITNGEQEASALKTNLEAAEEIARQLRLRDLGGIILIDFIDMKLPDNKKALYDAMTRLMVSDRARHTILPLSKFGLMQITRQRLRPEISINTTEVCPSCKGTGKVGPTLLLTEEVEKDFIYLLHQGHRKLVIKCHPMLRAFLKEKGFWRSLQWKWYRKHGSWLDIETDNNYHLIEYHFYDKKTDEMIKI